MMSTPGAAPNRQDQTTTSNGVFLEENYDNPEKNIFFLLSITPDDVKDHKLSVNVQVTADSTSSLVLLIYH